jgi:NAD(P)-dependent dehydrogenase (short-subunit alcohol dehydrogenase family)
MSDLQGRTALVTGSSRGIGAATSRALAAAGALVIATDVVAPHALATEIGGVARRLDVTQESAWTDTIAFAQEDLGGLDILVNNAGIFALAPVIDMSLEAWRRIQAVNVEGVFLGCKHAVPLLSQRAYRWAGGSAIINMSSIGGLRGSPEFTAYAASKGAVRLMTKCLALELADRRIRVNSLHPGLIDTDMGRQLISDVARRDGGQDVASNADVGFTAGSEGPMAGAGTPENIADAVVFLASDKAAFMNGAEFVVDGGLTAQ